MRIMLAPIIGLCILYAAWGYACLLLCIAAATDYLDGYIARNFKQESLLGSYLDPLADKMIVIITYGTVYYLHQTVWNIPFWFLALVLIRESMLMLTAAWLLHTRQSAPRMRPTMWGKLATVFHLSMLVIGCGSIAQVWAIPISTIQQTIWPIIACMMISAIEYAWGFLGNKTTKKSYL